VNSSYSPELWSSDRELRFAQVIALAEETIPNLERYQVSYLGSGWDNDVYSLNSDWILRFPRREEVISSLEKEVYLSSVLVPELEQTGVPVPNVKLITPGPSVRFPYPIGIYPMLKGVSAGADPTMEMNWANFIPKTANFLRTLHSIPVGNFRDFALPTQETLGFLEWLPEKEDILFHLHSYEVKSLDMCAEWLDSCEPLPPFSGDLSFIHNDLSPEHILLDPEFGTITGVIDWEEGAIGDPVADFVTLPFWIGWENTFRICDSYSLSIDDGFLSRLEYGSKLTSLAWLYDEAQRSNDLSSQISYIERVWDINLSLLK
tara:strand:- start:192 stop:1145 length:954 start_codon:yes stop_codon:yes gene_type:complete